MFFSERLKRPVWIASGSVINGVRQYAAPVEYRWNWRTFSTAVGIMAFGPSYSDYRKAVATNAQVDNIKRLDRVWLESTPGQTVDPLATTADFYIFGVVRGAGGVAEVTFKRLSADGSDDAIS